jgi:CBS-domain-containing membrane protein
MQRTVQDVMTRDVVVAHESTPFHELVELLSRKHVRALPVVDDARHVLGVVCDSDLVLKEVQALRWPCDPRQLTSRARVERAKAAGVTAREVMTRPAVTVHPEELVADAARRLHAYRSTWRAAWSCWRVAWSAAARHSRSRNWPAWSTV